MSGVPCVAVAAAVAAVGGVAARTRTRRTKPLTAIGICRRATTTTRTRKTKPLTITLTVRAMRAVVQRVASASVEVEGRIVSEIGPGLLVLVGIHDSDSDADADYMSSLFFSLLNRFSKFQITEFVYSFIHLFIFRCRKVLNMRLFPNENTGKAWDHSVMQKNYQVLLGIHSHSDRLIMEIEFSF